MRLAAVVAASLVGLGAGSADAQPQRCEIHVLRAPDAVRSAIDDAVRAETRCATSLVVRVVPTDKGLYVLAELPSGRAFEVVLPDARAVAQQVAAWSVPARPALVDPMEPLPVAPKDPASVYSVPRVKPPGVTPTNDGVKAAAQIDRNRWVSLAGVGGEKSLGARFALDLGSKDRFSFGFALQASDMQMSGETNTFEFSDRRIVLTGGYTMGTGSTKLRAEVAGGLMHTSAIGHVAGPQIETDGFFPTAEASLQANFEVGRSWAVTVGPMVTLYGQEYRSQQSDVMLAKRDLDVSVLGGLRYRL